MEKNRIQELLENAGYECRDYSGRGMNGKECLAVCTDKNVMNMFADILDVIQDSEASEVKDLCADASYAFRMARTDQMGRLGIVLYFPGTEYVKE